MPTGLVNSVTALLGPDYQITGEIGSGGMAMVFGATERLTNRAVAIKVLPPLLAYNPIARERFIREARIAAGLDHPGIIPIHRAAANDEVACIVMKFVEGESLGDRLAHTPRLDTGETRALLAGIADALGYAHAMGVVHRDMKPDNIMIEGDTGRPIIMDFGIARALMGGVSLTRTGSTMGTPAFMSPEQTTGEDAVDHRSDIYSLGIIGYCMLAGALPFTASNPMAMMAMHMSATPTPLRTRRPDVPEALAAAIERAMARNRTDRWQTAHAFREALGEVSVASFRPVPRRELAASGAEGPAPRRAEGWLSPEARAMVRHFQHRGIESVTLVTACGVLNWLTSDTNFTLFVALLLGLNLLLTGLSTWTEGIPLGQMFTRLPPLEQEQLQGVTGPSAEFTSVNAVIIREMGMDASGIQLLMSQLDASRREELAELSKTVGELVAHAQALGEELVSLEAEALVAAGGAGPAAAGLHRKREERRVSLKGKIDAVAAAVTELRMALFRLISAGAVDAMGDVQASAACVATLARELSAGPSSE